MKKQLFCLMAIGFGFSHAYGQTAKNKILNSGASAAYTAQTSQLGEYDVSMKSAIRFDMHATTADERAAANMKHHTEMLERNPNYDAQRNAFEQGVQTYLAAHRQDLESNQMVVTLPVVVHCVYGSAAQNITLNQVLSQIQVMNEDFGRTNADANTHWTAATSTTIQFCLAQQTPTGGPTTGLETRQSGTSSTSWSTNDNVKSYASGGLDIWDPTRYLNIWVCNLTG